MVLRAILPLFLFATISGHGAAQVDATKEVVHIVGPGSVARRPATSDAVWQRVREAASKYRQYAPVPRVAFYDITYPATAEEYRALDGYGLLLVTVITQDPKEVPLARVSLVSGRQAHTFQLVSSVLSPVGDTGVSIVLGSTRFDALYLLPMHLRRESGQLLVDFATNRRGFVLGKFPLEPLDDDLPTDPPSGPHPPPGAFGRLVERELPAFVAVGQHK